MDLRDVPLSYLHLDLLTITRLMGIRQAVRPLHGAAPIDALTMRAIVRKVAS